MVTWGSVEIPALEHRPAIGGKPERWPAEPGYIHVPTGIRLDGRAAFVDRGQWCEWNLFAPHGEDWLLHIVTAERAPGLRSRIAQYHDLNGLEYSQWTVDKRREEEEKFLRCFGEEFTCSRVVLDRGSALPEWTPLRREALIALIFIAMERSYGRSRDPYPSKLEIYSKDVPKELHGVYRNPAWDKVK